jgi:hypothetical protein
LYIQQPVEKAQRGRGREKEIESGREKERARERETEREGGRAGDGKEIKGKPMASER